MENAGDSMTLSPEYFAHREIMQTDDGSKTLYLPYLKEQYHSRFGAITESRHIYIRHGLLDRDLSELSLFEVGFGTGLNAMMSYLAARDNKLKINYVSIDLFPLTTAEYTLLGHSALLDPTEHESLQEILNSSWNKDNRISSFFSLRKIHQDLLTYAHENTYDVVYFDAFAPSIQPGLWAIEVFRNIYTAMNTGGILVTYSSNTKVQRSLHEAGFQVNKLAGPPGKREILQAIKK